MTLYNDQPVFWKVLGFDFVYFDLTTILRYFEILYTVRPTTTTFQSPNLFAKVYEPGDGGGGGWWGGGDAPPPP